MPDNTPPKQPLTKPTTTAKRSYDKRALLVPPLSLIMLLGAQTFQITGFPHEALVFILVALNAVVIDYQLRRIVQPATISARLRFPLTSLWLAFGLLAGALALAYLQGLAQYGDANAIGLFLAGFRAAIMIGALTILLFLVHAVLAGLRSDSSWYKTLEAILLTGFWAAATWASFTVYGLVRTFSDPNTD